MPSCLTDEEVHELSEAARLAPETLEARLVAERKALLMVAVKAAGVRNQTEMIIRHHSATIDSVLLAVLLRKINDFDRELAAWNPVVAKQLGSAARAGGTIEETL